MEEAQLVTIYTDEQSVDTFKVSPEDVDWWYRTNIEDMFCAHAGYSTSMYFVLPHRELPSI